jgi:signal transduction histidine kinase/ActR/RegA family two-component response regulator
MSSRRPGRRRRRASDLVDADHGQRRTLLQALTRSITTSLELDPILQMVAEGARALCHSDLSAIALREAETGEMVFRYRAGDRRREGGRLTVRPGRGAGGIVLQTGQPVRSDDVGHDPRFADDTAYLAAVAGEAIVTVMVVPITIGARIEGLLYVDNRTDRGFGDRHEAVLRELADHAAIAIRNAQLLAAAQHARAEAEAANRMKDEFLATLSHELRTPLNAVLGWAVTLRTVQLDDASAARALETIERNARAQSQLIDDLLDISRIVAGKLRIAVRNVDPPAVVEAALEAVRPAAHAKSIELVSVLDDRAGLVSGDPDRLQQVVWNLLTNAIKFTGRGGRIEVRLARTQAHAGITVTDSGQGIAPEMLPFVFDHFRQADSSSTRSQGGLGIGLALVRTLTELHGGTVEAESGGVGRGATFRIRLPLSESAAATPEPVAAAVASLAGVRALVVDDDGDTLELCADILGRSGAEVRCARQAAQALEAVGDWRPDVVITDLRMPDDDGYALIRDMRARSPEQGGMVPVVALTASTSHAERARVLAAGFRMHVHKPVEPAELIAVVASVARDARTT